MRQLHLIRHAESASNAGLPSDMPHTIPITPLGQEQADRFAAMWDDPPQLIVHSPFIRTEQTSVPLRNRFPGIPVEKWEVQEWTYLCPKRYKNTTHAQRHPAVEEFWNKNDPLYHDGEGAESLAALFHRVGVMLTKAAGLQLDTAAIFTHGHFMRATLWSVLFNPRPETKEEMARFRYFCSAVEIPNVSILTLRCHNNEYDFGGRWTIGKFWNLVNQGASK
jgi:2,3-bisphosphoglycerate-dependent phosphoglycerate mutase